VLLALPALFFEAQVPMGKYCYGRGRRRMIEAFTTRHGLWILAVVTALSAATLLLYVLGYLHFND
jgi:hypothetical protein